MLIARTLLFAALLASLPATAQQMQPGEWQFTSTVTSPPSAWVIAPAWTAAVQMDESAVYGPLPHTDPNVPPGEHSTVERVPGSPVIVVALRLHDSASAP